jgi:hypothetical protein
MRRGASYNECTPRVVAPLATNFNLSEPPPWVMNDLSSGRVIFAIIATRDPGVASDNAVIATSAGGAKTAGT